MTAGSARAAKALPQAFSYLGRDPDCNLNRQITGNLYGLAKVIQTVILNS
jgi:hypothetical protein